MSSTKKLPRGKPQVSDADIISTLLFLSAISKSLAKDVMLRSSANKREGGACYGYRKKTQRIGSEP